MTRHRAYLVTPVFLLSLLALVFAIAPTFVQASGGSFIGKFNSIGTIVSTVPKKRGCEPLRSGGGPQLHWNSHQGQYPGEQLQQ